MQDQRLVWRDGELIPFADATCHVLSHMAARGSQVFDVLLVTPTGAGPCAVGLRPHVTRFQRSAELMGMEGVGEIGGLEQAVAETVAANLELAPETAEGPILVKLVAAWTEEPIGIVPADLRPSVFVLTLPVVDDGGPRVFKAPIAVRAAEMPKLPPEILPPSLKVAASYTPGVRAQLEARAAGFDHTVFRTADGDLAESTTLSMLVVAGGRLLAPPLDSVLDGITRRVVLDVAQHLAIPIEVRAIRWDEVEAADELLLSSTNNPVLPIGRLDDRRLDAPGPVTTAIGEAMVDVYAGSHPLSDAWLTPLGVPAASQHRGDQART